MSKNNLLKRDGLPQYKPFKYPLAYEMYKVHESLHWLPEEIELSRDVKDWNSKLSDGQKALIKYKLLGFTQSDIMVGAGYDALLRIFKPTEVQMMLRSFAARENVHIDAYSLFTDTLGEFNEDTFYDEYKKVDELRNKMEYIHKCRVKHFYQYLEDATETYANDPQGLSEADANKYIHGLAENNFQRDTVRMLAVYGGLVEGISLFSSFAILMNFQRTGVMQGLGTIVDWSIRDENMHCEGNVWLARKTIEENIHIWDDDMKKDIYDAVREIVQMEDAEIDLAFGTAEIPGLTREDMKLYIRHIADRRLIELGLKPNFGIKENPLPWMEEMINSASFQNFFAGRVTDYAKGTTQGTWDDCDGILEAFKEWSDANP